MSKKLSEYIAAFDYIGKVLIFFSATCGGINKYYFLYKCYWDFCRNSMCKFYFNIFFNCGDNQRIIESNKK